MKALTVALLSTLLSAPAWGQQQCGPMDQIAAALGAEYQEVEIRQGISLRGHLMHLFMSPDGATWTIVGEKPGTGVGCVFDGGTNLQEPPMPEPDQGTGL